MNNGEEKLEYPNEDNSRTVGLFNYLAGKTLHGARERDSGGMCSEIVLTFTDGTVISLYDQGEEGITARIEPFVDSTTLGPWPSRASKDKAPQQAWADLDKPPYIAFGGGGGGRAPLTGSGIHTFTLDDYKAVAGGGQADVQDVVYVLVTMIGEGGLPKVSGVFKTIEQAMETSGALLPYGETNDDHWKLTGEYHYRTGKPFASVGRYHHYIYRRGVQ